MDQILIALGAAAAGVIGGILWQRRGVRRVLRDAEQRRETILLDARKAAELQRRETVARAREQVLELQRRAEAEQQAYREECALIEERVRKGEARVARLQRGQEQRQTAQKARQEANQRRQGEVRAIRDRAKDLRHAAAAMLEKRAGQMRDEIAAQLVGSLVSETRSRCADYLRNLEGSEGRELDRQAKRVMGIAIQRYVGYCPRERSGSLVVLEPKDAERLRRDAEADLNGLREFAGVEIHFSEDETSLRIDTGDGVARELCRRGIARILKEQRIKDPKRLFSGLQRDLEQEIVRYGRQAFAELKLDPAASEISDLLGKLNWRTSYTQNQYRHSIEAARLAGLMADELGLDRETASRGTLLHDIGKALTHSVEGSHALLGAEIARRNGEAEFVANAIGAHHGEEPMGSAYAWLATAADAMSGGRPGARREMTEAYGERIGDLEKIASSFKGVQSVHAAQAGRELRVLVDESRVGEDSLGDLSDEIAERISAEMTFPGQIRVTVIREFRAVAEAN